MITLTFQPRDKDAADPTFADVHRDGRYIGTIDIFVGEMEIKLEGSSKTYKGTVEFTEVYNHAGLEVPVTAEEQVTINKTIQDEFDAILWTEQYA